MTKHLGAIPGLKNTLWISYALTAKLEFSIQVFTSCCQDYTPPS